MSMNRDVFLSILAMDSYQRGYSPRTLGLYPAIAKDGLTSLLP